MIIFLDTNILYNHWHLNNANFNYLFNYLENTNSNLFISEIVCEEVDNKFNIELNNLKKGFNDNLNKAKSLSLKAKNFDFLKFDVDYSIKSVISQKTPNAVFFTYDKIANRTLVNRAINKVRPFQNEDKGFRDSLIWLSFLERLTQEKKNIKIAFISNNSSDFYSADKASFHQDLQKDIKEYAIESEFYVYESIKDFIAKEVDLEKHTFKMSQILEDFIYPNERNLEKLIESHFNSQSANWFSTIIKQISTFYDDIRFLVSFKFHIVEGIEDPDLISWSKINDDLFFAEVIVYLRNVDLEFTIPKSVYLSKRETFDEKYYDVVIEGDYATIYGAQKVFLNISFYFDRTKKIFSDIAVNEFM